MSLPPILGSALNDAVIVLSPLAPKAPRAPHAAIHPHALSLGDVTFADFEIPDSLPLGGAQALAVQTLPGGRRVIDAMGPEEADICWQGRFRGANGAMRARRLDTMRSQGDAVTLVFGEFRRRVAIKAFLFDIGHNGLEIPYRITLSVLRNDDFPVLLAPPPVGELVAADMERMQEIGSAVASVQTGISTALTAYQAVKSVRSGNYAALGSVIGSAATLAQTVDLPMNGLLGSLVSLSGTATGAIHDLAPLMIESGLPGGGLPGADASSLITGAVSSFTAMAQLLELRDLADRAAVNVGNQVGRGITWTGPKVESASP